MRKTIPAFLYRTEHGTELLTAQPLDSWPEYTLIGTGHAIIDVTPESELVAAKLQRIEQRKAELQAQVADKLALLNNEAAALVAGGKP